MAPVASCKRAMTSQPAADWNAAVAADVDSVNVDVAVVVVMTLMTTVSTNLSLNSLTTRSNEPRWWPRQQHASFGANCCCEDDKAKFFCC